MTDPGPCDECWGIHDAVGEGAMDYDDIVLTADWMARNGYEASEVAYLIEKPWKFHHELACAEFEAATS